MKRLEPTAFSRSCGWAATEGPQQRALMDFLTSDAGGAHPQGAPLLPKSQDHASPHSPAAAATHPGHPDTKGDTVLFPDLWCLHRDPLHVNRCGDHYLGGMRSMENLKGLGNHLLQSYQTLHIHDVSLHYLTPLQTWVQNSA